MGRGGVGAETDEDPVSDIVCNSGIRESGGGEGNGREEMEDKTAFLQTSGKPKSLMIIALR